MYQLIVNCRIQGKLGKQEFKSEQISYFYRYPSSQNSKFWKMEASIKNYLSWGEIKWEEENKGKKDKNTQVSS